MNQRDQVVVELYRQAWEASRHPWNLLLSFTSLYVLVGVAVIAYLAQAGSGPVFSYLLVILSGLALVGILWTLRANSISEHWTRIQTLMQKSYGIILPDNRDKRSRFRNLRERGIGFNWTYLGIYVVAFFATLICGLLFLFGVVNFRESAASAMPRPTVGLSSGPASSLASSDASKFLNLDELDCSTKQQRAYCDAIIDAAKAEPDEISTDLVAITRNQVNPAFLWNSAPGESLLLTVTLTDFFYADGDDVVHDASGRYEVGEPILLTQPVWVTIVPELQNFCRNLNPRPDNITLRLQQLLGLPPRENAPRLVELWVNPLDLFRPSIDPQISDHEAEISPPQSDLFTTVSPGHSTWFNDRFKSSYTGKSALPWTRLGYSYDWGNVDSKIGLSEFVIRQGSTVGVRSISEPHDYC